MTTKKKKQVDTPKCTHCNKDTDKEHFCYGCKAHVCDDCEVGWPVAAGKEGESYVRRVAGYHLVESENHEEES